MSAYKPKDPNAPLTATITRLEGAVDGIRFGTAGLSFGPPVAFTYDRLSGNVVLNRQCEAGRNPSPPTPRQVAAVTCAVHKLLPPLCKA